MNPRSYLLALVVCGCVSESPAPGAETDGDIESGADCELADATECEPANDTDCEIAAEPLDSAAPVTLRVENTTEQTVFVGGSLGFGCPGFSLEAVGADVGAVPGTGRSTCADASWCPNPGHGWCPGLNLNPIQPGQSYETTWNGRIFLEVEVPACFGCEADTTCASELVAPAGPYQVRFATYTTENDDAATGTVEAVFEHPSTADVVLQIQ